MPMHLVVRLPDGRDAWIDHSEPIAFYDPYHPRRAGAATRCLAAVADHKPEDPADLAEVAAWLDAHAEQSERCRAHHRLRDPTDCGHR